MSDVRPGPASGQRPAGGRGGSATASVMSVTPGSETAGWDQASPALEVRYARDLGERAARLGTWPAWLAADSPVRAAAERIGISALWAHQSTAAEALYAGRHVVLTTGTASGKSLAYLLPVAATEIAGPQTAPQAAPGTRRRRPATSLYLAPTKALAHDQARLCAELAVPGWRIATVDGDTDPADRRWARDHAHHVLTNPDLLHASLLPNHARWASFLRSLRYVVVDEAHRYRGVFGAQVAAVLRRLRRVATHYGADPVWMVASATASEPIPTTAALTGIAAEDLQLVDDDASPRGPLRISLARSAEDSPEVAAAAEMAARVRRGQQVLTFVPSRRLAEEVARSAAARAGSRDGEVLAYRAGYLAMDRRLIERGLAAGTVRGVAATNALELGVDITGLDAVLLCGYPGNRAAFWQQVGRAGRRGSAAEVVLIARPSPLDAYLLDHPGALFDEPIEAQVLDPSAPPVLGPQLAAAAQELPLRPGDERWFGPSMWPLVARLTDRGLLRRRPDGWYWTAPQRAVDRINLRTADARTVDIVDHATGRVLGTVAASAVDLAVHPGAVYVHQGDTFLCEEPPGDTSDSSGRDPTGLEVFVHAARPGYLTQPLTEVEVCTDQSVSARLLGDARLAFGPARVRSTVTGFLRRDEVTGQVWDSTPLDCAEHILATAATVLTLSTDILTDTLLGAGRTRQDGAIHALEHLMAGLLPAIVANDRADVGAHSWLDDDGVGVVALFDRQPGSGFAIRAYGRADAWLSAVQERVETCSCESGCPACILAPGCTSARSLNKNGARLLLAALHPREVGPALGTSAVGRGAETGQR